MLLAWGFQPAPVAPSWQCFYPTLPVCLGVDTGGHDHLITSGTGPIQMPMPIPVCPVGNSLGRSRSRTEQIGSGRCCQRERLSWPAVDGRRDA